MSVSEIKSKIVAAADQMDETRAEQLLAYAQALLASQDQPPHPHAAFLRHAGAIEPVELHLMQQAIDAASRIDRHEWLIFTGHQYNYRFPGSRPCRVSSARPSWELCHFVRHCGRTALWSA